MRQLILLLFLFFHSDFSAQEASGRFPKNNSSVSTDIIQFVVNSVPKNVKNRVLISTKSDFTDVFIDTTYNSLAVDIPFPSVNRDYFWKVKSYTIEDSTEWSSVLQFSFFKMDLITDVVLWLSAKNIFQATGSQISIWNDLSSYNNAATQANTALQPVYNSTGGFRNNSYVNFLGNRGLTTPINNTVISNDSVLGFISLTSNRNQGYGALFYIGNSGSLSPSFAARTAGSSYNNGAMRFLGYNGSVFTFDQQTPNSSYKIITGVNAKTNTKLFSGGNLVANTSANIVPVASGATLKVGSNQDFGENYSGLLHELIIVKNLSDQSVYRSIEKYVDNSYVPRVDIGGNKFRYSGLCDSAIVLDAGANYTSYLWSTGATTRTINPTKFGKYSVVVIDELGYTHTDQITYRPNLFLRYPGQSIFCFGDSILWESGISSQYSVVWSDGKLGANRYVTNSGNLSFKIVDGSLCEYYSDTIDFVLDNYSQTTTLGNDTTLCSGNLLALKTNQAQTVTYLWPDGSTGSNYAVDTTGNYFVETTNVHGCVAKDTIHVTIAGLAPVAQFVTQNACLGEISSFQDQSSATSPDVITDWAWTFGDGDQSNLSNPTHEYLAPGTYSVQLYVETNVGCGAFQTIPLTVFSNPKAGFKVNGYCSLDHIQMTDTSKIGGGALSQWEWDFGQPSSGAGNTSTLKSPTKQYVSKGNYTVQLLVTDVNGCTSQAQTNIEVKASPETSFNYTNACAGFSVNLNNQTTIVSPAMVTNYLWTFGDGAISVIANPTKSYANYGSYEAILKATSNEGCVFSDTNQIIIHPIPVAILDVGPACKSSLTELLDLSTIAQGSIVTSKWYINLNDSTEGSPAYFVFNTTGQQQVVLKSISDQGCFKLKSILLDITEELKADFNVSSESVAVDEPVFFMENTIDATEFSWDFGDGNSSVLANPSHVYSTNYTDSSIRVILEAKNTSACRDTQSRVLQIKPYSLDLELKNVFVSEVDGQVVIGVELKNNGNTRLTKADLEISLPQIGSVFTEVWNGSIGPNKTELYVLKSKVKKSALMNQNGGDFICINALGYDAGGRSEMNLENNRLCVAMDADEPILTLVSPNPANEFFGFDLILSKKESISLEIIDSRGQVISNLETAKTFPEGYHRLKYSLSNIDAGVYFLRMTTAENKQVQRFVKE